MLEEFKFTQIRINERALDGVNRVILQNDVNEVRRLCEEFNNVPRNNIVKIGYLLNKLEKDGYYRRCYRYSATMQFMFGDPFVNDPFLQFIHNHFGLSRKKYELLKNIYIKFGDEDGNVKKEFEGYLLSHLVEMLSMNDEQLNKCYPGMTVNDMRKIKKKIEESSSPIEEPSNVPEIKKASHYVFDDMKDKKEKFKTCVKRLFDNQHYRIWCNGTYIGGQAFGNELFDYLEKRGFFDANSSTE